MFYLWYKYEPHGQEAAQNDSKRDKSKSSIFLVADDERDGSCDDTQNLLNRNKNVSVLLHKIKYIDFKGHLNIRYFIQC